MSAVLTTQESRLECSIAPAAAETALGAAAVQLEQQRLLAMHAQTLSLSRSPDRVAVTACLLRLLPPLSLLPPPLLPLLLQACIKESLRLSPPGWMTTREALADVVLPCATLIPQGTVCYIDIRGIQRDPDYWPNPEAYQPERFLDKVGGKNWALSGGERHVVEVWGCWGCCCGLGGVLGCVACSWGFARP